MTLTEQVYDRAAALAGTMTESQQGLMQVLCAGAVSYVTARLKPEVSQQSCQEALVMAAALYALAGYQAAAGTADLREFRAGDLTVKQGGVIRSRQALLEQVQALMAPYWRDGLCFLGV